MLSYLVAFWLGVGWIYGQHWQQWIESPETIAFDIIVIGVPIALGFYLGRLADQRKARDGYRAYLDAGLVRLDVSERAAYIGWELFFDGSAIDTSGQPVDQSADILLFSGI